MKRPGPDGVLVKATVAFPYDVWRSLEVSHGRAARAEIRRIVTEHVRSREAEAVERDPESGGAEPEPAVQ
jgi:hypothetical protein